MHVVANAYWLPKQGHQEAEYEDAFAPDGAALETDQFRCAIADGATEASFSRQWARALVQAWQKGVLGKEGFVDDVGRLQENWRRRFAEVRQTGKLPWYAEQKADLGAFATLLGFVLHHDRDLAAGAPLLGTPWWVAVAVGDSNLFQVRDGRLLTTFPLTESAQFGSGPFLVPTRGTAGPDLGRHTHVLHGDWLPRDTFYLMTDALAAWFLRCCEGGEQPWDLLEQVLGAADPQHAFASLVRGLRERKLLHNDDVTLLRIHVDVAPAAVAAATPLLAWDEPETDDVGAPAPTDHPDTLRVPEQES
jgi:hypothetical protein